MKTIAISLGGALGLALLASQPSAISAHDKSWKATSYRGGETQITGSGRVVSEARRIGRFARLAIDGPVDVVIRQGAHRSLVIEAEDNIMPLVRATTERGMLSLDTKGAFRTRTGIKAVLTVPSLERVDINASGDVRFDGWNARDIALVIGGSGDIELGGEVANVRALIRGSGDIDLAPTRVSYVDADIDGSGVIRMGSLRKLDATIDGSGSIQAGVVGELDAVLNGSGEIIYRSADRVLRMERNGSGRIAQR